MKRTALRPREFTEDDKPLVVVRPIIDDEAIDAFVGAVQEQLSAGGYDDALIPSDDPDIIQQQRDLVERIAEGVAAGDLSLRTVSPEQLETLISTAVHDVTGVGPIQPLLADPDITEIIVHWDNPVLIDRHHGVETTNIRFRSIAQLERTCQHIARNIGRSINQAEPICDAWLADGSRVNIVFPPVSPDGPCLTIRRFDNVHRPLSAMVDGGSLSQAAADLLISCVEHKVSILISGATGSGKTTLLRALAMHIPEREYLITLEDTLELRLRQHNPYHVRQLLARPASSMGTGSITHADLLRASLRMRPDRIIVGEVRGAEALDFVQALSTGHEGGLSTIHAGSPAEAMLVRLPTMIAAGGVINEEQARVEANLGIELIIQLGVEDRHKVVHSISEVVTPLENPSRCNIHTLIERQGQNWQIVATPTDRVARKLEASL